MLLKMIAIPVVFYILLHQIIVQAQDIYPAKILVGQRTVSEGSDLYVTCSKFGQKKLSLIYMYLLKDGQGFKKTIEKQNQNDVTFKISRVHLDHSGNYSCAYSTQDYNISTVNSRGQNVVKILVIAHFIPAALSVVGPSTIHNGNRIEFKCTFSETLHTLNNCQVIYCCLKKNKTFLQMQIFDVAQMECSFTIESAVKRDLGNYSCLLLPTKCFQEHWNELQGINEVFLDVKEDMNPWKAMFCRSAVFILLFSLCLCWIFHKNSLKVSSQSCERLNEDVLVQTDGEPHQEEDSFSMGSEEDTTRSAIPQLHTDRFDRCFTLDILPDANSGMIPGKEQDSNLEPPGPPSLQSEPLTSLPGNQNCAETTMEILSYSCEGFYSLMDD